MIRCTSGNATGNYVPPVLGNGELSVMLDMEGVQRQVSYPGRMTPMIWWAGRRYNTRLGELIPFGFLGQNASAPEEWTQDLDVRTGSLDCDCRYGDGTRVHTTAFVHLEQPILAIRKSFDPGNPFTLTYTLAPPGGGGAAPARMRFIGARHAYGIDIHYDIGGQEPYQGTISFLCDRPVRVETIGNQFRLTVTESPAAFFLVFLDSMNSPDVQATSTELRNRISEEGFDGLFQSHRQAWEDYWGESYVKLGSEKATAVYEVAQYHLRISATRWSIPTGIFAAHWHGRYFGFDEYFPFMALAGSGHLDTARGIPEFRYRGLDKAVARAHRYFGDEYTGAGARFHWETDENGDDRTPSGFWLEHIFHMAHIALCAWYYYLFSGDRSFLEEKGYSLISKCADFYETQFIYRVEGGRFIVGKCTDLERLGAARENAFMTTCGVIATFEAAARAAERLGIDGEKAAEWSRLAQELRRSLPVEEERYVPYPGCPQKSIAVFAGTFPYPVLPNDDRKQAEAIRDFMEKENIYGNMYPVGDSVCVWYAGWMGVAFARLGMLDKTLRYIDRAVGETNCFSEIFEISKPAHHPWFTTAEGVFIQMVNESLIQSSDGVIRIMPNPDEDCSFKLAAVGGVTVEAELAAGVPRSIRLRARCPYSGRVILPDGRELQVSLAAGEDCRVL